MENTSLLNERLVCLSRVHARSASFVASTLGIDLGNFNLYLQHDKSKSPKPLAATSSRRKRTLPLSSAMVSSLSKLHQLDKNGFTHPMLDSWLVKTDADWHRLNACFEITPLLAVDSNASIARLGLVHEYGSKGGVTLYSLAQSDACLLYTSPSPRDCS